MFTKNGYCVVKKRNGVEIYDHRRMMELILKRKLESNEFVHHKDGNRWNNCPFNLEVMLMGQHISLHRKTYTVHRGNTYSDRELLLALIKTKQKLGRWPGKREQERPHEQTYKQRFGSWSAAIRAARHFENDVASH